MSYSKMIWNQRSPSCWTLEKNAGLRHHCSCFIFHWCACCMHHLMLSMIIQNMLPRWSFHTLWYSKLLSNGQSTLLYHYSLFIVQPLVLTLLTNLVSIDRLFQGLGLLQQTLIAYGQFILRVLIPSQIKIYIKDRCTANWGQMNSYCLIYLITTIDKIAGRCHN